jgi:hypothetical protein
MFYESVNEVLDSMIKQIGGYKVVGSRLRGDKVPDQAAQWLRDCMNGEKRERLDPDQVMALVLIAREQGVHDYADYFAQATGYAPPVPLTQDDITQRAIAEGAQAMQQIAAMVAALKAQGIDLGALAAQAGSVRGVA